jgi:LAO/AO transport system kinase
MDAVDAAGNPAGLETLERGIRAGDRRALARAITLVESTRPEHRERAAALLARLAPDGVDAIRIGISGAPGVGKSTFIEAFGLHAIGAGRRIAVLTIDPSSALSGGAILGDKTRMPELSRAGAAFIRPSPSGGTLGGVARRTRETIPLCEAAGYDLVVVETVGVGQSEVTVAEMTDMFVLLVLPGGGDELQGIKRGIMELADLVLVNKADGDFADEARRTAAEYGNALRLLRRRSRDWMVPVQTCSALTGQGIDGVWEHVARHAVTLRGSGSLAERRAKQARAWLWRELHECLVAAFDADVQTREALGRVQAEVVSGRLPASVAAQRLVTLFTGGRGSG